MSSEWINPEIENSKLRVSQLKNAWDLNDELIQYFRQLDTDEESINGVDSEYVDKLIDLLESLQNHFKYLSLVYVSGYFERILSHALMEDIKKHKTGWLTNFVEPDVKRGQNPDKRRINQVINSVASEKMDEFNAFMRSPLAPQDPGHVRYTDGNAILETLKKRNNAAHMRSISEVEGLSPDTLRDLLNYSTTIGNKLIEILNPNN